MSTVSPAQQEASVLDRLRALESEYLLQNYARYPIAIHRGKGCYAYDTSGKRYLDFITGIGVNALGHAHPRLVRAIREQAALLLHSSNLYYSEYQGPLAERLAKISGLQRTFFCNSGAESMEGAMKMIRSHGRKIHPEKYEIISLAQLLSRQNAGGALHNRPGKISQGFRTAAGRRKVRSAERRRSARTSRERTNRRNRHRVDTGRRRHLSYVG